MTNKKVTRRQWNKVIGETTDVCQWARVEAGRNLTEQRGNLFERERRIANVAFQIMFCLLYGCFPEFSLCVKQQEVQTSNQCLLPLERR